MFLISLTELWDMMIHLCMCKSWTQHVKVQQIKSGGKMATRCDFYPHLRVKLQSKSYISHEIYEQKLIG